jgi:VanZ family protein
VKIIAAWGAVAAWMALVWWLGSNDFAASRTSPWLESLIYWLFPDLPRAGHLALSITIRKLAHPTVYGVLAGLNYLAVRVSGFAAPLRGAVIAFSLAVGVAVFDEARQAGLSSRTGSALDVMLDASGCIAVLAVAVLFARRQSPRMREGARSVR